MSKRDLSASSLHRARACAASAVLPRVDVESPDASRGTALHKFLADAAQYGRDEALAMVPEDLVPACESIPLDRLPIDPTRFRPEVALAFNLDTGKARELGMQIARRYQVSEREIPGTTDVLGVLEDYLMVGDFKTGWGNVPPAATNLQVRFLALAACRAHNLQRASVAIIRVREDGEPWYDEAELTEADLDETEYQLHELWAAIDVQQAKLDTGKTVDVSTGAHCSYCPAKPHCPAYQQLLGRMATSPGDVEQEILSNLTPKRRAIAYRNWRMAKDMLSRIEGLLRQEAELEPIDLGDGTVWGPVATTKRVLDGDKAFKVIEKRFGREVADLSCERDASQASIKRGLKAGNIKPVSRALEQVLEDLACEEGGIVEKPSTKFDEHRAPPKELPASPAGPSVDSASA